MSKCIRGISIAVLFSVKVRNDHVPVNAFADSSRKRRLNQRGAPSTFVHQEKHKSIWRKAQCSLALVVAPGGSSNPPLAGDKLARDLANQDGVGTPEENDSLRSSDAKEDIDTDQFLSEFKEEMKQMRLELDRELEELKKSSKKAVDDEIDKVEDKSTNSSNHSMPSKYTMSVNEARNSTKGASSSSKNYGSTTTVDRDKIKLGISSSGSEEESMLRKTDVDSTVTMTEMDKDTAKVETDTETTRTELDRIATSTDMDDTTPRTEADRVMQVAAMDTTAKGVNLIETTSPKTEQEPASQATNEPVGNEANLEVYEIENEVRNEIKEDGEYYPETLQSDSEEVTAAFLDEEAEHKVAVALNEGENNKGLEPASAIDKGGEISRENENESYSNNNIMDFDEAYDMEEALLFDEAESSGNEEGLDSNLNTQETDITTNKEALSMTLKETKPLLRTSSIRRVLLTSLVAIISALMTLLLREFSKRIVTHFFPLESQQEKATQVVALVSGILSYLFASVVVSLSRYIKQSNSAKKTATKE